MTTHFHDFAAGTLTLGSGDVEVICQVIAAQSVPSNTRADITTACGTITRYINERADLRIRFLQDWYTNGISNFLWDHYGTNQDCTFSPCNGDLPRLVGQITCPRPTMGGDAGQPLTDEVVAPWVGIPTKTPAGAAP